MADPRFRPSGGDPRFKPPQILEGDMIEDAGFLEAFGTEFGQGIVRGFLNVGAGIVGTAEWAVPGEQESWLRAKENIEAEAEGFAPEYGGLAGKAGRILGEALPYMGTALVGGYAGAGAAALAGITGTGATVAAGFGAASVAFSVEGQNAYDDAIRTGATEDEANRERLIIGSINAVIEAAQITKLMKFHKAGGLSLKSFIRNVRNRSWDAVKGDAALFTGQVLRTALEEGLEEAAQEGVSISIPGMLRGEMPRKADGSVDWGQVIDRVGAAGLGGAFAGAVLGGAGALVKVAPEIGRPSDKSIDGAIEKVKDLKLNPKEEELWISRLEEHRIEQRDEETAEQLKKQEIPPGSNVYQTEEGRIVIETPSEIGDKASQKTELRNGLVVDKETGETLTQVTEGTVSGRLDAPKDIPAMHKDWDQKLVDSVKEMDTSLRQVHEDVIKKQRGERIAGAREVLEVLKDKDVNVRTRYAMSMKMLEGDMGLRFNPLKASEEQINYFYQRVLISPEAKADYYVGLNATQGLDALFGLSKDAKGKARLPQQHEIDALGKIWGEDLRASLNKMTGAKMGKVDKLLETLNFPRALLASFDFSAAGRQGLMLLPVAPKQWSKALWQGYRAWTSPQYAEHIDMMMQTDPYWESFKTAGGSHTEVGDMKRGEEVFMSRFASKIPGIKASERAYTTTLNSLRFYTYKKYALRWTGTGKNKQDYEMLAGFINHATGRGDLKGLEKYAPFLNAAFFAPRLQMGRIQAITDLFKGVGGDIKARQFNPVRKIIAADLAAFFGGGMGILWLASMIKGVKVEKDPRSSDFGKIRFGKTRIDFWSGYSQIARLMARMVTGEVKGTETGDISETTRGRVLWRFLQTKLSPGAGIGVDLARGETFLGEPLDWSGEVVTTQIYQRFTPLFFQDVTDSLYHSGLTSASIVAPLALHGIGAMTYQTSAGSEALRIKDITSMEVMGVRWNELGPEAQDLLMEARPEIKLAENKAKVARKNFAMVGVSLREQRRVTDRIVKQLPSKVRQEIKDLDVYIPGLSRRISDDWYLNDTRYKQYQTALKEMLSTFLPRILNHPAYKAGEPEMKASMLEELIGEITKEVRTEIVNTATMSDLKHVSKMKGFK